MGRFFFTLAWIILLLLVVDSAMNDPDVQPVVDRQFQRVERSVSRISGWIHAKGADASAAPATPDATQFATLRVVPDSTAADRYRSTMPAVAVALAGLAKSTWLIASRSRPALAPAAHPGPRHFGPRP